MMKDNPIFIFNYKEELKAVLSNEGAACQYFDDKLEEELNGVYSFSFSIPADHPDSVYVIQGARVLFKGEEDAENEYQEFEVMETVDIHTMDGIIREVACEHASAELNYNIITDSRPESTAKDALTRAIAGSRWTVGEVADLGTNRTNFYYINSTAAIADIRSVWGGETKYRTIMTDGVITSRTVSLYAARGQFRGKRFEWNKDIKEMKRTIDFTNTFTALYGRGGSVQDEEADNDSTYSRKIGFESVHWSTSNGDPANKPEGQKWVGDESAKALYGIKGTQHRYGVLELEDDVTDPTEILRRTWEYLQTVNTPMMQYECSVEDFYRLFGYEHEKAFIGDIVYVIDHEFPEPILVEARVIKKEAPLSFDQSESVITIGNFIPDLYDLQGKITELDKVISDNSGDWGHPIIDDTNYPNTTPDAVSGLFIVPTYSTNNLFWDLTFDTAVRGYNIYASQISGFTAGQETRIAYVGKVPSYSHPVTMGATWYYRIAAVNYHGVEGPLSAEVSSSASPIPSDAIDIDLDIIGEEIVQEVKEYTDAEIAAVQAEIQTKADVATVYTKEQVDALNATKANLQDVYTKTQTNNLLAEKVDSDAVYTKEATDSMLAAKAELAEVEEMLDGKADAGSVYTKTEVDTALNGKVSTTTYNQLAGTVTNHTTQINQNATNIALKADKTEVDTLKGTVTNQGTAILQNATNITLKADQTEVNTLKNAVTNQGTLISQNAEAIALKASQSEVNTLTGKVSNVESQLTIQADQIATKVSQTEIDEAIDNLDIGGRNWFMNTKWDRESNGYYISEYVPVEPLIAGEEYTVQIEVDPAEGAEGITLGFSGGAKIIGTMPITGTGTQIVSMSFVMEYDPDATPEDGPANGNAIFYREPYGDTVTGVTKIRRMKIEKGNVKTDWTPAPEESEYRLDAAETTITQTAEQIALKADKTEVNTLRNTVTSQGTSITANANAIALKADKSVVDSLAGTVSSHSTAIEANAEEIELRATKSELNTLTGTVSSQGTKITQNAEAIALKADKTTVDSLSNTVTSQGTSITANANAIALKADKSVVDTLNSTVSSQNTRITANANAIALKANQTDLNALTGRMSTAEASITAQAGQIALKVSQQDVETTIANTKAGGTNLLLNSDFSRDLLQWRNWGIATGTRTIVGITDLLTFTKAVSYNVTGTGGQFGVAQDNVKVIQGETYTVSVWFKPSAGAGAKFIIQEGDTAWTFSEFEILAADYGKWKRYKHTFVAKTSTINIYVGQATHATLKSAGMITGAQLELGPMMSDWSASTAEITTRLNSAETTITQTATNLNLKADKNGIVSAINISSEGIKIDGAKIQITGTTTITNGVIKSAHIDSVAANKISATSLHVISANLGNITAGDIRGAYIYGSTLEGSTIRTSDTPDFFDASYTERLVMSGGYLLLQQKNPTGTAMVETSFHGFGMNISGNSDFNGLTTPTKFTDKNDEITYGSYGVFAYPQTGKESAFYINANTFGIGSGSTPVFDMTKAGFVRIGNQTGPNGTSESDLAGLDLMSGRLSIYPFNSSFGYITSGRAQVWFDHKDYEDIMLKVQYRDGDNVVQASKFSLAVNGNIKTLGAGQTLSVGKVWMNGYNTIAGTDEGAQLFIHGYYRTCIRGGGGGSLTTPTTSLYLGADGTGSRMWSADVYGRTYTSSQAVQMMITDTGTFGRLSSSSKYKLVIEEVQKNDSLSEFEKILQMKPKSWFDKTSSEAYARYLTKVENGEDVDIDEDIMNLERSYGLIAEDMVEAGLENFVAYKKNADGTKEVEGISYHTAWTYLIPLVKDNREEITTLKEENATLKSDIAAIKEALGMA